MVETKTMQTGKRRMGMERWKYLDMANLSFAGGEYRACKGYIEAFLATVKEDSKEGETIRSEFYSIEEDRRKKISKLEKESENWGYLEQTDAEELRKGIEVEAVYDQKTACWLIAMELNMFEA